MQIRGQMKRHVADTGFAISDHADWNGLIEAVKSTGAHNVLVTHGHTAIFSRYLNEMGINAGILETNYGEDPEN
jgi:putative mRNA 3-end processing factor